MNCPKCGVQLPQGTKFCGKCGAGVHSAATTTTQSAPANRASAPSKGPVKQWFLYIDGKNQGPFSPAEVAGMVKSGAATPETNAWKQGLDGWKKISELKELTNAGKAAQSKKAAAPAQKRTAARKSAAPASSGPVRKQPSAVHEEPEENVSINRKAAKKYKVERKRREAAESYSRAKEMRRSAVEQSASLKVMKTRDGVPIKFYEEPYFVLPAVILPVPIVLYLLWNNGTSVGLPIAAVFATISLFLLFYSRKFGGGGKLFLSIIFLCAMGAAAFFGLNRELVPGAELDINKLPSGINATTYAAINLGMSQEYLYFMMGDAFECKIEKSFVGEMNACIWDNEKTHEQILIKIKNGLVTWKHYEEPKEEDLL